MKRNSAERQRDVSEGELIAKACLIINRVLSKRKESNKNRVLLFNGVCDQWFHGADEHTVVFSEALVLVLCHQRTRARVESSGTQETSGTKDRVTFELFP